MAFPYVSDEVKNATYEIDLEFNNGTQCHMSSYFSGYQLVNGSADEYWYSLTRFANNPSSVVNIQPYIVATSGNVVTPSDFDYIFNNIHGNDKGSDYYLSDEYIELRDIVFPKVKWIWGSPDDGGFCCYRPSAEEIAFVVIDGFYEIPAEGEPGNPDYHDATYGYSVNYVINPLTINDYDFTRVCFMMNAIEVQNDPSLNQFHGYFRIADKNDIGKKVSVGIMTQDLQLGEYDVAIPFTDMTIIEALLPTWIDTLNADGYIFTLGARQFAMWDVGHVFDGKTRLSGNPYGNAEIDDESNPYYDTGFSDQGGGGASLDNNVGTSDPGDADIDNNGVDVCSSNLVLMYSPTPAQISALNTFLYSGITTSIEASLKKLTSDPLQYIISLGLVHFKPPTGATTNISFGGVDTGVGAARINKQMKSFDCGYIDLRNEFKSFIDYNSRVSIYLPYIGQRELNINEVRGSRIRLKYNIDMLTGSCIAYLHISRQSRGNGDCRIYNNMYFFEGNCMLQIPMFATDNRGTMQALLSAAGAGVSLATGNVAGAVSGIVGAATQQRVAVGRAGSIGSNYGYMSGQEAYLIIERPIMSTPKNFGAFEGWTSNMYKKISSLKGYTEIDPDTLWTDSMDCTEAEAAELKSLFNSGVYL